MRLHRLLALLDEDPPAGLSAHVPAGILQALATLRNAWIALTPAERLILRYKIWYHFGETVPEGALTPEQFAALRAMIDAAQGTP